MIKVNCPEPSAHVAALLARRQQGRNGKPTRWESRSAKKIHADREINEVLREAFNGKCGYCECIEANTIDHLWPRHPREADRRRHPYPDRTWDWNNFVLACTNCQNAKLEQLPLSEADALMVNPRMDEPLRHLRFDPDTGKIFAAPIDDLPDQRGLYTIEVLDLEIRPDLDEARRVKYKTVLALITDIVDPHSTQNKREVSWELLELILQERREYLAIVQQLFTFPPPIIEPLLQELYHRIPAAHNLLARFRRLVSPVHDADNF